ncbi:hypothetical protein B566_EDAN008538, partial [Ephemera danica]
MYRPALILLVALAALAAGRELRRHPKALPGQEDWGYVEVRPGARMFYWLYYSTAAPDPATLPLVIWLQGGPGASSTGYGNFEIIGPLDLNLEPRNSSWIADDLVTFTKAFYTSHPEFETTPLAIFGESYGGKMDIEFALELDKVHHVNVLFIDNPVGTGYSHVDTLTLLTKNNKEIADDLAIKAGELVANLKAVAIGDGWVSPIDSTTTWAPFLWHTVSAPGSRRNARREKIVSPSCYS